MGRRSRSYPASAAVIPSPGSGFTADQALPWLIDVDVFEDPVASTNWITISVSTSALLNAYKSSNGSQNASLGFDIVIANGTWTVETLGRTAGNQGIISVQFDGVEKGTIDQYSAGTTDNVLQSVTGIAVATSAKVRLSLVMATKNASSSNYFGFISHIQLRRTA